MSDTGDCGGGDSGGGGCDSSCGAPDSSYHCDSSHNSEDCHSTGQGSFNDVAGSISSNSPRQKHKDKYRMNSQRKEAEVQQQHCCCTLI